MNRHSQRASDERLWQMLDTPGVWLVRTDGGMLRPPRSLREALWQAWTATTEGETIVSILKLPEYDTVIEAPQVWRLAHRLARISQPTCIHRANTCLAC